MKAKIFLLLVTGILAAGSVNAALSFSDNNNLPITVTVKENHSTLVIETTMAEYEVIICDREGNFLDWTVNKEKIDISGFTPGTYLLHIRNIETGEVQWDEFSKE